MIARPLATLLTVAVACLATVPSGAHGARQGCVAAEEAIAAGDDEGPPRFSEGFFHTTLTLDVSTDGLERSDLAVSIEDVCDVPAPYTAEAVQLAGNDGVAVISSRTRVYSGKRLLRGKSRRRAIDGADTMRLRARLARPSRWRAGEEDRVPTFSTKKAVITD
jgi:hypothetical protein